MLNGWQENGCWRVYRPAGWGGFPFSKERPSHVRVPRKGRGWEIANQPGMHRYAVAIEGGRNRQGRVLAVRSVRLWAWSKHEALDLAEKFIREAGYTYRRLKVA